MPHSEASVSRVAADRIASMKNIRRFFESSCGARRLAGVSLVLAPILVLAGCEAQAPDPGDFALARAGTADRREPCAEQAPLRRALFGQPFQ